MRVVVTGARGKVGTAAVARLLAAGHEVVAADLARPTYEQADSDEPAYVQADLTDAGDAFALARGAQAVVHAAAIPAPNQNTAHTTFANNLLATFNVLEAAVRWGVRRFVNISSETVPGFVFAERPFLPDYLPIDENHPLRPQDPYALSKHFGEQLMDAAVRRSDLRCISLRPSWVQWEGNYERNLGPLLRDPYQPSAGFWSYIDVCDLADAILLSVESDLAGHEVLYIASPDNATGLPLADLVKTVHGDRIELRPTDRKDASGVSCAKARRLLGYAPSRSWRDHLTPDGHRRVSTPEGP
jgi:nucleoside-diphosphate-sugar epimerase